ncbi:larval cuticle protein A2B-like [Toxorhynchites rutilus septentrionalis]|uniref:larval cuticle protein A2B-like n=1 Tax=Toxorhynchites rutilus septentrionalis TaxID=329112 RepID=UPI00247924D5|nr:larval cuticle protein A2B-like [Toxorhynchites rutilus septentrionalis]
MSLKIVIVLAAFVGVIAAQHYYQPHHHEEEHHGPVHYEFNYDIHDDHTGDVHGRKESRKDDQTQGEYYLIDADGHKRTVTYHVDGKSGFIAQVHREPIKGYQAPQQVHKVIAAPVHKILAAPVHKVLAVPVDYQHHY